MNKLLITGRLGSDPSLRHTRQGKPVVNCSVAVNEGEDVTWYQVTAWGQLGVALNNYKKKGDKVLVEGRLAKEPWAYIKEDGELAASYQVTAKRIEYL